MAKKQSKPAATKQVDTELAAEELSETVSISNVIKQSGEGGVSMYLMSLPIDKIYPYAFALRRQDDSVEGFQRYCDPKRVQEIAEYLNSGKLIPGTIAFSAQPEAEFEWDHSARKITFKKHPNAFLSIDGQHRFEGYNAADGRHRIVVQIFDGLTRQQEAEIFSDVNGKHKGVPSALMLDIKALAGRETNKTDTALRELFDMMISEECSPMRDKLSPTGEEKGKINRVTFNAAVRPVVREDSFSVLSPVDQVINMSTYLNAFGKLFDDAAELARPVVFASAMAVMMDVFSAVMSRGKGGKSLTEKAIASVLEPARGLHLRDDGKRRPKGEYIAELRRVLRAPMQLSVVETQEEATA